MLLNITQFILHASFFKLICAKLGIDWTSAPKYQSNFSCCENFRKYNGSLFVHNTCKWWLQVLQNFPMILLFRLWRPTHAPWLILSIYETAPASVVVRQLSWQASLCFLAQVVWMCEEYNSVLSTPIEADTISRFGRYRYIGKTQISANILVNL